MEITSSSFLLQQLISIALPEVIKITLFKSRTKITIMVANDAGKGIIIESLKLVPKNSPNHAIWLITTLISCSPVLLSTPVLLLLLIAVLHLYAVLLGFNNPSV
jgi:hypothetical protein